ncbi:hypothetical protein ACET3Z_017977 [Daucus carota]
MAEFSSLELKIQNTNHVDGEDFLTWLPAENSTFLSKACHQLLEECAQNLSSVDFDRDKATLWSIWLARNELVFSHSRISRETLEELIFYRFGAWSKASGLIAFASTPLWRVNPQGALAVHCFTISKEFWHFKYVSFDFVCAVDGAWELDFRGFPRGGIGGNIKNKSGKLQVTFSGPVTAITSLEAEILSVKFAVDWLIEEGLGSSRSVICSDSIE